MVPLSSLVSFEEVAVAPNLPRQDQRRAVPMSATLGPEHRPPRGDGPSLEAIAAEVLPPGMGIIFTGEAKELNKTSSGVVQTFAFALLVVLLVLAAQFESFISAVILMATVPFGLAAAVFAMLLTGGSLNIYSQIGLVMLVGLMSKNGILIVEFANQLRDQGQSVRDAIRNAAHHPPPPGGDDHDRHRPRRPAADPHRRRRGRGAAGARLDRRRRARLRHLRHALRHAGRLQPARPLLASRASAEEQRLERELDEAGGPRGMTPTAEELGEVDPAHGPGGVRRCWPLPRSRIAVLRGCALRARTSARGRSRAGSAKRAQQPGAAHGERRPPAS